MNQNNLSNILYTYGEELIEYVVKCNLSLWQSKCFCNSLVEISKNFGISKEESHIFQQSYQVN